MIDDDLRGLYYDILINKWSPSLEKVNKGLYHIYLYRPSKDGVPRVLREPGVSFKDCRCCKWKPD